VDGLREAALATVAELGTMMQERERTRRGQLAELGAQVTKLGQALDDARREGALDGLTGLGNRRAFDDAAGNAFALHALWGQATCVVLFDVDGLQRTNDALGRSEGDVVLCALAARLTRACLRRTDALCRHGEDEFSAVLRETTAAEAGRLAERIVTALAEQGAVGRVMLGDAEAAADGRSAITSIAVSAGVAEIVQGETADQWIARANAALAEAKRAGGGRVVVAS
jgi:diguanylate cyclase (GGDEF)-like protein